MRYFGGLSMGFFWRAQYEVLRQAQYDSLM